MQRDAYIDFFLVPDAQLAMHDRLLNWSRWVRVNAPRWQAPIWRLGKSSARQWHEPPIADAVDTLDGHAVEKAVAALPAPHRDAIRWSYVWQTTPARARRSLGVTNDGLMRLVTDARSMLMNRGV